MQVLGIDVGPALAARTGSQFNNKRHKRRRLSPPFLSLVSIPSVVIIRNNGFKNFARP